MARHAGPINFHNSENRTWSDDLTTVDAVYGYSSLRNYLR